MVDLAVAVAMNGARGSGAFGAGWCPTGIGHDGDQPLAAVAMVQRPASLAGNERIGVPHDGGDAPIPLALPGGYRMAAVPGHQEPLLLFAQAQVITVGH